MRVDRAAVSAFLSEMLNVSSALREREREREREGGVLSYWFDYRERGNTLAQQHSCVRPPSSSTIFYDVNNHVMLHLKVTYSTLL